MIVDSLSKFGIYTSVYPRLGAVMSYLSGIDLSTLEEGKYEIDGDNIFMTVVDAELKKTDEAFLETHDKYIDIQIVISGTETFGWKDRDGCTQIKDAYSDQKDIAFFYDKPSAFLTLNAGECVVFFPGDAHAPLIGEGRVKKCIVKVRS